MADTLDLGLEATVKTFFDRPAVMREFSARTLALLIKVGSFVRRTARGSIRSAKNEKPSLPGRPPKSQTGLLKDNIFFAADMTAKSVVVGPVLLNGSRSREVSIPDVLEHGGMSEVTIMRHGAPVARKKVYIEPRPYMVPAFEKGLRDVQTKFPELWSRGSFAANQD
jgi:hypothetical protein